ncbi:MAG: hypothetical protein KA354_00570 [Phycisphaerae bacterium]|nr:hypothetical protein [Phycisphaerae bacterium]
MANHQHVIELKLDLALREVLRMMGGAHQEAVRPELLEMVNRLLEESIPYLRTRGVYGVWNVERLTDRELALKGAGSFHGPIAAFLRPAGRVAVFAVTIGSDLERIANERRLDGKPLEGYILQSIGSSAADAASDAFVDYLWQHEAGPDEGVTPPFSPGFCGISIEQQKTLFSIVDASPIGVRLLPSMMMSPVKSISGLAGIGAASEVIAHGLPCEYCELERCQMRRTSAGGHLPRWSQPRGRRDISDFRSPT